MRQNHANEFASRPATPALGNGFGRVVLTWSFGVVLVFGLVAGIWVGKGAASREALSVQRQVMSQTPPEDFASDLRPAVDHANRPFVTERDVDKVVYASEVLVPTSKLIAAKLPVAEPAVPETSKVRIALIMDDMGLNSTRAKRIADLPARLTLSWLPYAGDLEAQTRYAFARDHQIFAHVPMEPGGDEDPGPGALMTAQSKLEVADILKIQLAPFVGLSGINNHMGSKFTESTASMSWFMAVVKERNLLFVDSLTSPKSQGAHVAAIYGLPSLKRDIFIDHEAKGDIVSIRKQLAVLEAHAREKGWVIAIGHPYKETIEALETWVPEVQSRGVEFVTIAQIVEANTKRSTIVVAGQEN